MSDIGLSGDGRRVRAGAMRSRARGRASGWTAGLRLLAGGRSASEGALVFAYHDVGARGPQFTPYSVSPARLREQLTAAREWGLRFVALPALVDILAAGGDG